ncbi:GIY-YIG nuclease family protein [Patescibacteria group bacterium]|nr:GIY-YIG nuclease family protein [Patescibacteria group bacterium]MBU1889938.1 GIY-YIG nuclease family protein [Patescibacteria group bacterium]
MSGKTYYVYIVSNRLVTTLYIGITNDLLSRVYQHKTGMNKGFSKRYNLKYLLYFEETDDVATAISREKKLKRWRNKWKIELIQKQNSKLEDLAKDWYDDIA